MRKRLKEAVSSKEINQIISHQLGPDSDIVKTTAMRGGLFNTSYKIKLKNKSTVILRIAPSKDKPLLRYEKALLKREAYFLAKAPLYGFPAPKVIAKDLSKKIIDRDYIILECMQGQNAFYKMKSFSSAELDSLCCQLAQYAKQIHAIENKEGWFGCPQPLKKYSSWSEFFHYYAMSLHDDLMKHPYLSLPQEISLPLILKKMKDVLDEVTVPRLIHGDLWWRNVLVGKRDQGLKITAILDWDRGVWGDPYFEWILYGLDLRPSFWQTYGTKGSTARSHKMRILLYKSCGCLQAALEDSIHFNLKKHSLQMTGYAINNLNELIRKIKV